MIDVNTELSARIEGLDWRAITTKLHDAGHAHLKALMNPHECEALVRLFATDAPFRKRVDMGARGFGMGEYKYFSYPLPPLVQQFRAALYPPLATVANEWHRRLGLPARYPQEHAAYISQCHNAGQPKPTALLLRYQQGDYNRLHQDLYGALVFPLQVVFLLSQPGADFTGGEFIMTEQIAGMQSRVEAIPLQKGDAVVFASQYRPVPHQGGVVSATMQHGVSTIRHGERHTFGIIFHDAS